MNEILIKTYLLLKQIVFAKGTQHFIKSVNAFNLGLKFCFT